MRQLENSIRIARQADQTVITLQGALDQDLATNLVPLVERVQPPILFDFKQVSHVTAAGSRIILGYFQSFGVKPMLRHVSPDIISLLKLTGAIHYVSIAEDQASAHSR